MALRKIGKYYYCYFRDEFGKLHTLSTRQTEKDKAKAFERDVYISINAKRAKLKLLKFATPELLEKVKKAEALAGQPEETKAAHKRGTMALKDMLPALEKIHTVSPTNKRAIIRFIDAMKVKYADEVTPHIALQYLEENYSNGRNYKAFNNNRGILNKMFRLLLVQTGMESSPFERISCRTVKDVESHRPITDEEFRKIIAVTEEPFRTAACLGFYAGADMSTAFGLPGTAVNLEERIINWKRPKSGTKFICGIHKELLIALRQWNIDNTSEFPILPKTCTTTRNVYFRQIFNDLGITDTEEGTASFHSFRTSFFTRCDKANLHRRTTSLAGGHTDDRMNDLYSHDVSAAHEVETLPDVGIFPEK